MCSHCAKTCGKRVAAELALPCEGGVISNSDGVLVCRPANGEELPDGTFADSCHGCHVVDGALLCSGCLDGTGKSHATTITMGTCATFGNEQGKLVCLSAGEDPISTEAAEAAHDEL